MIDLDSDDNAVREAAFGAVPPTLILQAQHVATVFAQQLDEDMVMSGYLALVQHYLPDAKLLNLLRSLQPTGINKILALGECPPKILKLSRSGVPRFLICAHFFLFF